MQFSDLPLFVAVFSLFRQVRSGSEKWLNEDLDVVLRHSFCVWLDEAGPDDVFPWSKNDVRRAWQALRKSKQLRTTCEVAILYGASRCFYGGRGVGECDDVVHLDRILPESRGGEYTIPNCILSCGFHNTSRGDRSLEEFLNDSG